MTSKPHMNPLLNPLTPNLNSQATDPTPKPTREDFESLVDAIQEGRYPEILKHDQLMDMMKQKRAFLGFSEPKIDFPCTFKVSLRIP